MKTTIDLPDELFHQLKVLAAERSTTLRDIITQALRQWMRTPTEDEERERKAAIKRLLRAMQASNTAPMTPLTREETYDR